ncbi:MAG: 50S ribosomal protein L4 [Gammaproteobacteria bacterium RIFCSPHIGHO2_12_FULL_42_13]|nr:MAG: 50S ribosomal protein L4 [Gammaproteobacteria bacterium RIFCSPHIGHO2_12_FULL_42_13]
MKLEVNGGSAIEVSDQMFACEYNEGLVHQLLTAHMAAARQGSKAQKTRAMVRGGGKKPWKQKGTGQARAGTSRGPLWRGGGVTFAAVPRDFSQKINKRMFSKGMCVIFSELARQNKLVLVSKLNITGPKTKNLLSELKKLNVSDALIVGSDESHDLYLAARNLPNVDVCDCTEVNPLNLLSFEKVLMTTAALEKLNERFKPSETGVSSHEQK